MKGNYISQTVYHGHSLTHWFLFQEGLILNFSWLSFHTKYNLDNIRIGYHGISYPTNWSTDAVMVNKWHSDHNVSMLEMYLCMQLQRALGRSITYILQAKQAIVAAAAGHWGLTR